MDAGTPISRCWATPAPGLKNGIRGKFRVEGVFVSLWLMPPWCPSGIPQTPHNYKNK
jgi:hypothetical protein